MGDRGQEVLLASTSQRRVDLLGATGLPFRAIDPGGDEEGILGPTPEGTALARARAKARAVAEREPGSSVLAADTVVVVEGEVLGKAEGPGDVGWMLRRLSGRRHSVTTAVVVMAPDGARREALDTALVVFRRLSPEEVLWYVGTGEGVGKAGGYAIQGLGGMLVAGLDGDRETVVGLPTRLALELLARG